VVQILEVSSTTSICDWYGAPLSKLLNQLLIDPFLKAFVIRRVYQKLGAVWLKCSYGRYEEFSSKIPIYF
jgi:hypothetical protein